MCRRPWFALIAALAIAACGSPESQPTAPLPNLGLGNDPDRIRVRDQRREPFTLTIAGCLNEPLVVTGMANFILQAQDNPGGNTHFRMHVNLQGVSGVTAVTGTQYHLTQTHNATLNYVAFLDPPRFETNQVFRYRLIGAGPDNNSWINISYHLTMTPNGEITATWVRAESRCMADG